MESKGWSACLCSNLKQLVDSWVVSKVVPNIFSICTMYYSKCLVLYSHVHPSYHDNMRMWTQDDHHGCHLRAPPHLGSFGSWDPQVANLKGRVIIIAGWWFGTFFIFPYIGNVVIPIDFPIFQRGSNHQPGDYHSHIGPIFRQRHFV